MPNSIYYVIGTFLNAGIPFLFLPILTRMLSAAEYGALNFMITIYSLAVPIISIALPQYAFRVFFEDKAVFKDKVESAIATVLCWFCMILLISSFITILLFIFGFTSPREIGSFLVILISAFLNILFQLRVVLLNAEGKAKNYVLHNLLYTLIIFSVTLVSLYVVNSGSLSRVVGTIFADFLFATISIRQLYRNFDIKIKLYRILNIDTSFLKFGCGLVPHLIASVLLSSADKIIIASSLSMEQLASYALAVQFTSILMIYTQGISKEWSRYYLSNRDNIKNLFRGFSLILSILLVSLVMYLSQDLFFLIFVGDGYRINKAVIIILLISQVCHSIYMMISVEVTYLKKTYMLSSMTLLALCSNVIVSVFLVGEYGIVGVAIGTMTGMAAKLLIVSFFVIYSRKSIK